MNTPNGFDTDHINSNGLDNRKSNLRITTRTGNLLNMNDPIPKNNKSGFRGVSWHKKSNKWRAFISVNRKQISLGLFNLKKDAVNSRKTAERKISLCVSQF